jgi:hypothetical protein
MPDDELGNRSHQLFGRKYRLALWAAIAARDAGEAFTNGDLVRQVHLTSGEVSKELAVLVGVGLVVEGARSGTKPFHRVESGFWDGCLALHREWSGVDGSAGQVIPIR